MKMKYFVIGIFFVAGGLFWNTLVPQAEAGTGENTSGFAWGGGAGTNGPGYDGMGWISFNNTSDGSSTNYGVMIPLINGAVSGYAWSEHYGYISFNASDLSGCNPVLTGAARTGNTLTGGARIIAIRDGMLAGNAGGFDGCISLSGAGYGVTIALNVLSGSAWSSDLGWINFSGVNITPSIPSSAMTMKLCENSCTSSFRRDTGSMASFAMNPGAANAKALYACLGTGICTSGDVAISATWTENSSSPYSDVIDRTPTTNPVSTVTITGKANGQEKITASFGTYSAEAVASVNCSVVIPACDDSSASAQATCVGSQYVMNYTDTCTGLSQATQCNGKRNCNYNWKEVAP